MRQIELDQRLAVARTLHLLENVRLDAALRTLAAAHGAADRERDRHASLGRQCEAITAAHTHHTRWGGRLDPGAISALSHQYQAAAALLAAQSDVLEQALAARDEAQDQAAQRQGQVDGLKRNLTALSRQRIQQRERLASHQLDDLWLARSFTSGDMS